MIHIVWCLLLIEINAAARLLNCPPSAQKFEKVLGVRPETSSQFALLYKLADNSTSRPVTAECLAKCQANENCKGFVLYYSSFECFFTKNGSIAETQYVVDNDVAFFTKTCLKPDRKCDKLWVAERIPGAILIGNDTKTLPQRVSRTDCEQYCLNETRFQCRSAKFKAAQDEAIGTCILSNTDRHLLPNAYRVSSYDDEYLENECSTSNEISLRNTEFCSYEEYDNVTLAHTDMAFSKKTREECQNLCDELQTFNCRAYSIVDNDDCRLHSEDSKIFGPTLLKTNLRSTYYEKARCLNITVSCTETYMTVVYTPELDFHGKLYMQGYSENVQCAAVGEGRLRLVSLKIPLLTSQCGVSKAVGSQNRTLLSGTLIIQFNPYIQTQSDRVIRVGCIFGNDSKVIVGTGVKIKSNVPNKGSPLIKPSVVPGSVPMVEMKIVDPGTGKEVSDTQIGQELQLTIVLKTNGSSYDIWASHLVAMTEKSEESIFLLDDRGCPTDLSIFPGVTKIVTKDKVELTANFQAFKFAASPVVRFSVIIQFCEKQCPKIDCGSGVISHGRKRREIVSHMLQTINGTTVFKINRTDFSERTKFVDEMPLEYIMLVRDSKSIADRLIYGENGTKILIAGYDFVSNEVCMDYSLVIGLIVLWIIIHVVFVVGCIVIVRRYKKYYQHECTRHYMEELHKNFGIGCSNLENRRVHWAENDNIL